MMELISRPISAGKGRVAQSCSARVEAFSKTFACNQHQWTGALSHPMGEGEVVPALGKMSIVGMRTLLRRSAAAALWRDKGEPRSDYWREFCVKFAVF